MLNVLQFYPFPQIAIMIASHNEETVGYTVNKMREYNIHPLDRVICFGQLLGMCDHISLPLGEYGLTLTLSGSAEFRVVTILVLLCCLKVSKPSQRLFTLALELSQ